MQPVSPRASRFHVAVLAAAGLATFTGAPTARAQQPAATSGGLEEVIVTAQKREQNLQEIGISLSAVSGSDLTDLGVVNATDITKSMPAVVLTQPNGPSSFSLAIRGGVRSEEHTSELQSQSNLVCRLLLEKKKIHTTAPLRA